MQLKYKSIFYFYKIKCAYYAFLLENIFLTKKKKDHCWPFFRI